MSPKRYEQERGEMEVTSLCVKCKNQNLHEVDHNGHATVTCPSCQEVYDVKSYQVRAKGGQRVRGTTTKNYSIRVKEPDKDETLLEFTYSGQEIEMRSGDWIVGSYDTVYTPGNLIYLSNSNIKKYWGIGFYGPKPEPKKKAGCLGAALCLVAVTICVITLALYFIF
jgi:predicted Zn finger-like uncharacterized protein